MPIFKVGKDKKAGEGLALSEWNSLCHAVTGDAGLTLALSSEDKIGIGTDNPVSKLSVQGNVHIGGGFVGIGIAVPQAPISIASGDGKENIPDDAMHLTNDCILFGGNNKGKEGHSAQISAGKHVANSLNIVGMSSGTSAADRKVNIWAEGGMSITGGISASGSVKASKFIGDGSELTNLTVGALGLNLATTSGNVGIGTANPTEKLQVEGNIKLVKNSEIFFEDNGQIRSSDNNHKILFRRSENIMELREWGEIHFSSGAKSGEATSKMVIAENGNVGIGATSPKVKLEVNGMVNATGLEVNGALFLKGDNNSCKMHLFTSTDTIEGTTATKGGKGLVFEIDHSAAGSTKKIIWNGDNNWDSLSDMRLKSQVANEENILDRLMMLDVKNYNWKDEAPRKNKMIGFIAQDVRPLFPALVGEFEDAKTNETTLTLKYASFGILAVGAIKELKLEQDKRIEALEKEVAILKKKLTGELVIG